MASATTQLDASFTARLNSLTQQVNAMTAQLMSILIALTGRPPVTAPAVKGPATDLGGA
jgi:hypothetical protein